MSYLCLVDTVGDAPLPSHSEDTVTNIRTSYDDLRRVNRAEHEKKKYDSRYESFSRRSPVSPPPPTEPPIPRKLQQAA